MNSSTSEKNLATAVAYYTAMSKQDFEGLEKYIHPEIEFIGPIAPMRGREAVLKAARGFAPMIKSLKIRAKFTSGDQVMLAYDYDFAEPIGNSRAASLMTFQDGLIVKQELFYDARPFVNFSV